MENLVKKQMKEDSSRNNMDNINLKIQDFSNKINYLIKISQLPIGVIYYVLKDIFINVQQTYYATLNSIIIQQNKEQQAKEQNQKQD